MANTDWIEKAAQQIRSEIADFMHQDPELHVHANVMYQNISTVRLVAIITDAARTSGEFRSMKAGA